MIPILYEKSETAFLSNGIGRLSDCLGCVVSEELNSFYTLEMTYTADGQHAKDIQTGRLVFAKPNDYDRAQPFRIYEVTKNLDGTFNVLANHISYDLSGYPLRNLSDTTAAGAVAKLSSKAIIAPPFTFSTDLSVTKNIDLPGARSVRAAMGDGDESVLGVYGGEWKYDRYDVKLLQARGSDNGVSIRYGKNLTELNALRSDAEEYTGALAYVYNESFSPAYVSSNIQYLDQNAVPQKILIVDHSSEYQSQTTTATLDTVAQADLAAAAGITDSLTVSFVPLWQSEEYKNLLPVERVQIGDLVTVIYEKYNISTKLEVVKTDYNVLLDRYDSIELGAIRPTLADTIASLAR